MGFFKPRITVRALGAEDDLFVYYPEGGGAEGVLKFVDGETYVWQLANFWATKYQIVDLAGKPLLSYTSKIDNVSDLIKDQARVEFEPEAQNVPQITLLIAIGWYLIVLQQEDVAATVTAVAAKVMAQGK